MLKTDPNIWILIFCRKKCGYVEDWCLVLRKCTDLSERKERHWNLLTVDL